MLEKLEKKLKQKIYKAFKETVRQLDNELRLAIISDVWNYPRITYRRSGEIAGSPRNIVDMGDLRDSQQLFQNSLTYYTFIWNVPYALPVHEGYTTKTGLTVPERKWTEYALSNFDFKENFINNFREDS